MGESGVFSVQYLVDIVREIYSIAGFKGTVKKPYYSLARRLKLLMPMIEEIRERKDPIPVDLVPPLASLQNALESARELLRFGSEASKIYLALERDRVMSRYFEVTEQLEQALCGISYDKLAISDEIIEQVELVIVQFKKAKGRVEPPDDELCNDLSTLYNKSNGSNADVVILRRVAEKLQLMGIDELMQESVALHEMVSTSGDLENMEMMSVLLKMIKEFVLVETPDIDSPSLISSTFSNGIGEASGDQNNSPVIPNDFRCPISLELMKDPVIVATGQTYERTCIEKWLEAGHNTCPKTQIPLSSFTLTPNYVLRSLIAQWCELHGMNPPKPHRPPSAALPVERSKIESLLRKLTCPLSEDQRSAAAEIRLLAKRNAANRVAIAEAGAVPLLVRHLTNSDPRTQEHAVTALLNLSICDNNKGTIISSGAVTGIVYVLKNGSTEARENAAATLFSLSVVDENKVLIGGLGAIPPLVALLNEGSPRGKKDAATALFNLCIYQGNKGKAVRAGVVPTLMGLLREPVGGMVDESLAILAILASHPDGKVSIGAADAVPVLVEIIRGGSPRNRENAAAILVNLCAGDQQLVEEAQKLGVMDPLADLAVNGTERGKRKAVQLLERMTQFHHSLLQTHGQESV